MDAVKKIKLHPGAKDFLFEHFANLRRIYSDVLGQLEIDYISIALLNKEKELFFLSSNPSIEQNLIEKELWQDDWIYQEQFIYQNEHKLWNELYPITAPNLLRQYKLLNQKLVEGISIPIDYEHYRAVLSFGFKESSLIAQIKSRNHKNLIALGSYCLNKISNIILFPDKKFNTKPKLTLIINKSGAL